MELVHLDNVIVLGAVEQNSIRFDHKQMIQLGKVVAVHHLCIGFVFLIIINVYYIKSIITHPLPHPSW